MFSAFFAEPFDIKSVKQFTVDAILSLNDVSALFYISKEYLRTEEDKLKFADFVALCANQHRRSEDIRRTARHDNDCAAGE